MAVFTLAKAVLLVAPSTINPALPLSWPGTRIVTAVPCETIAVPGRRGPASVTAYRTWSAHELYCPFSYRGRDRKTQNRAERPSSGEDEFGRISLRMTDDPASVEAEWEELQAIAPCTAPQTCDWAKAWARHVLAPEGHDPIIVVGRGPNGALLFLLAFETTKVAGVRVLKWLGGDHANYNMGLFAPDAASSFTGADIAALLDEVARQTGVGAAMLKAQPFSWDGVPNPFALLPHQTAPNSGYAVTLGDFTALYEQPTSASVRAVRSSGRSASSPIRVRSSMAGPIRPTNASRCSTFSSLRNPVSSPPWASRTSSTLTPAPSTARSR